MLSDQRQAFRGYLRSALVDGAKPFRYRGRVRSLLGTPDSEGSLTFSPTLPPVGFRYADPTFVTGPYSAIPSSSNNALRSVLSGEPRASLGGTRDATQQSSHVQDIVRRHGAASQSRQESVAVEPSAPIEEISLEIPGVSKRSPPFSALSPIIRSDTPAHQAQDQPRSETTAADSREDSAGASWPDEKETASSIDSTGASAPAPKGFPGAGVAKEEPATTPTLRRPESLAVAEVEADGGEARVGAARQRGIRAEPRRGEVTVEPAEESDARGTGIERASPEIPEVPERNRVFPALFPIEQGDTASSEIKARSQPGGSPAGSRGDVVRTSQLEKQESQSPPGGFGHQRSAERAVIRPSASGRSGDRPSAQSHASMRREDAPGIGALPTSTRIAERSQQEGTVKECPTAPPSPSEVPLFAAPKGKREFNAVETASAVVPPSAATHTVSRSNKDAADTIEQLRHAVSRLTAKVSSQQTETGDEIGLRQAGQTPPPPAQTVVIIRRPSSQTRTPCAFWERSYLGRFHLRTLR